MAMDRTRGGEPLTKDHANLVRAATRITKDRIKAEEIVQSLYVIPRLVADGLNPTEDFDGLLKIAVENAAKNYMRGEGRERKKREKFWRMFQGSAESSSSEYDSEDVRLALDVLKIPERCVVILRYWNDFTIEKCAEVLRIPAKRVSQLFRTAIAQLKRYLSLPPALRVEVRRNGPTSLERLGAEEMRRLRAERPDKSDGEP